MKHFFGCLIALVLFSFSANAQETPAATQEHVPLQRDAIKRKPANPALVNLRRYTAQLNGLGEALAAKDASKTTAYHAGLLQTMRQAIMVLEQQDRQAAAVPPSTEAAPAQTALPPAKNVTLPRMREILAAFEGFSFDVAKTADIEKKTKLLNEFQQLLKAEAEKK